MIGNYILSGRIPAIMTTVTSALLSLLMPPFAYLISGTVVALITLRKGAKVGLQTMAASLLALLLLCVLSGLPYQLAFAYAFAVWLPVCVIAIVLRVSESQGLAIFTAGLFSAFLIISMYLVVDDVAGWWRDWFLAMLENNISSADVSQYEEALESAAVLFNAIMTAGLMLNIVMSLLLARWWQSRLFNKGAFRAEFISLRLPSLVLPVSGIMVVMTFLVTGPALGVLRDILFVMLFMYVIQGVSAMHRIVHRYGLSGAWIVAMYCLLLIVPQMAILIACLGMTDVYVNWRRGNKLSGTES